MLVKTFNDSLGKKLLLLISPRIETEKFLEFKKIKVDTRNSLFYLAASFNKLKNKEKSNEYLNKATQNGKISINKFLSSQPFKDSIFIKDLETNLNNI